jgi:hypothetical protein
MEKGYEQWYLNINQKYYKLKNICSYMYIRHYSLIHNSINHYSSFNWPTVYNLSLAKTRGPQSDFRVFLSQPYSFRHLHMYVSKVMQFVEELAISCVRYEMLTAVTMMITPLWDVTSCSFGNRYQFSEKLLPLSLD